MVKPNLFSMKNKIGGDAWNVNQKQLKEEEIKSNLLLGDRYLKGIDVPKDINFAYNCYLKAGDLGSVEGYYKIAKMFDDGNGVKHPITLVSNKSLLIWVFSIISLSIAYLIISSKM